MSLRHKKRDSSTVSKTHCRKVLANKARALGLLKAGECSASFSIVDLRIMAGAH